MQTFSPVDIKLIVKLQDAVRHLEHLKETGAKTVVLKAQSALCCYLQSEIRKQMNSIDENTVIINALRNQGYRTE